MNKLKRDTFAVSEVMGTILLLGISVSLFSVIYVSFFAVDVEPSAPTVDLIGTLEDNHLILEHRGGEDLDLDTRILIRYNETDPQSVYINASDLDYINSSDKNDNKWNIGEQLKLNLSKLQNYKDFDKVDIVVVDSSSNSAVMTGTLKEIPFADVHIGGVDVDSTSNPNEVMITSKVINHGPNMAKNVAIKFSAGIYSENIEYSGSTTNSDGYFNETSGIWYINSLDTYDLNKHPRGPVAHLVTCGTLSGVSPSVPFTQVTILLDGTDGTLADWDMIIDGIRDWILSLDGDLLRDEKIELTIIEFGGTKFNHGAITVLEPVILNDDIGTDGYYSAVANYVSTFVRSFRWGGTIWALDDAFDLASTTLLYQSSNGYNPSNVQIIDVITNGYDMIHVGGKLGDPISSPEWPPEWPPQDPPDDDGQPSEEEIQTAQANMIRDLKMSKKDQINFIYTYENIDPYILSIFRSLVFPLPSQHVGDIVLAHTSDDVNNAIDNPIVGANEITLTIEAEIIYAEYLDSVVDNNYFSADCQIKVKG